MKINDLIYVYCMANGPPVPVHNTGIKGLRSLVFNDFCFIVKYVSESEFSEENFKKNLSVTQWLESNSREHIRIISMLMENYTVIPFKFGTIYSSKADLQKFTSDYSESLIENFHHINGREEWSVKIYCNRKALCEEIEELNEEATRLEKQIMASSPGKAFLLKRKKTDLIEDEVDRICKNYGREYFNDLRNLSESTNLNNLLPKKFTGREDTIILNATFLVSKIKVTDFKNTIDTMRNMDGKSGIVIEATGPWPPFSFISIKRQQAT